MRPDVEMGPTTMETQVVKGGEVELTARTTTTPLFRGWCGGGRPIGTTTSKTKRIWANLGGVRWAA